MKKQSDIFKFFKGANELAAHLENSKSNTFFQGLEESLVCTDERTEFSGTSSYEESENLLKWGDRDICAKIEEGGLSKMRANITNDRTYLRTFEDITGIIPHVPNFVAGLPINMINAQRMKKPTKVLNIVFNSSVSCGINTEDMIKKSIELLKAVLVLEASGIRVNLYSFCGVYEGHETCSYLVQVKKSTEKLNVLRLSYIIAHPSFFRRTFFRFLETAPITKYYPAYGRPIRDAKRMQEICCTSIPKDTKFFILQDAIRNDTTHKDILKMFSES